MSEPQSRQSSMTMQNERSSSDNVWEAPAIGKTTINIVVFGTLVFVVVAAIAFFWRRDCFKFGEGYVLDNDLWGTLGDFVGGVLGAVLAALSCLMMYWTLKAQRELTSQTNQLQERLQRDLNAQAANLQTDLSEKAINQAELQRFNDLFFELLSLYHRQKNDLDCIYDEGIGFFDVQMAKMQDDFKEYVTFGRAWRYAADKYTAFYFENASKIAPLFRTLYRLFLIIDNAPIENDRKLDYAKTVRAQLSEGELFFLRYNCLSGYGRKFTNLINKYRIIKHLPFLSLLENTPLRNKLVSSHQPNQGLALNWLIYSLWKEIYNRLVVKTEASGLLENFQNNMKYSLSFAVRERKTVIVKLEIDKRHKNNTPALRCLDRLSIDMIEKMLYDFLRELFIFSNSKVYNDEKLITFKTKRKDTPQKEEIWSIAKINEGNLRVSHPEWDSYYGIDN